MSGMQGGWSIRLSLPFPLPLFSTRLARRPCEPPVTAGQAIQWCRAPQNLLEYFGLHADELYDMHGQLRGLRRTQD